MEFISKLEDASLEQAIDLVKERLSVMAISKLEQVPQVSEVKAFELPDFKDSIALVSEYHKGTLNTSVLQKSATLKIQEFRVEE
jgi:hypothetical protein